MQFQSTYMPFSKSSIQNRQPNSKVIGTSISVIFLNKNENQTLTIIGEENKPLTWIQSIGEKLERKAGGCVSVEKVRKFKQCWRKDQKWLARELIISNRQHFVVSRLDNIKVSFPYFCNIFRSYLSSSSWSDLWKWEILIVSLIRVEVLKYHLR